MYGTEAYQG